MQQYIRSRSFALLALMLVSWGGSFINECNAEESEDRHELVAKLDRCLTWLNELKHFKANVTYQEWRGEDESGKFTHRIHKYQLMRNDEHQQAHLASAMVGEHLDIDAQEKKLDIRAYVNVQAGSTFTAVSVEPQYENLIEKKQYAEFVKFAKLPLKWYPFSVSQLSSVDPEKAFPEQVNRILLPKKTSRIYVVRDTEKDKLFVTYRLVGRAPQYFGMNEYVFDETDRKRPLLISFRNVLSKQGKVNYESEDDLAFVLNEIKTEYELNQELDVPVPIRISAKRNEPTFADGQLKSRGSSRMLATIEWSKPSEKTQDTEKLTKLVQGYREELEAHIR